MLDPSEEDSDDSGNGGRESPIGEGQMTDLEVCLSYLVVVVAVVFSVFFFFIVVYVFPSFCSYYSKSLIVFILVSFLGKFKNP